MTKFMIDFKTYSENGKNYLSLDIENKEDIDRIAYKAMKWAKPDFIIGIENSDDSKINYVTEGNIINLERFVGNLQIDDVLQMYQNTIGWLEDCEDWFLKSTGFYFDARYIFIDKVTKKLSLIYIPLKNYQSKETDIKQFFISVLEKCDSTSGGDIQLKLYKYFYKPTFALSEVKTMLAEFAKMREKALYAVDTVGHQETRNHPGAQGNVANKEHPASETKKPEIPEPKKIGVPEPRIPNQPGLGKETGSRFESKLRSEALKAEASQREPMSRLDIVRNDSSDQTDYSRINRQQPKETPGTSPQSGINPTSKTVQNPVPETPPASSFRPLPKKRNLFETMFAAQNKAAKEAAESAAATHMNLPQVGGVAEEMVPNVVTPELSSEPVLNRVKENSKYNLPKQLVLSFEGGICTIGRHDETLGYQQSTIEFGAEIKPISKSHAKIEKRGDDYYLCDLGSGNGTYLNGSKIIPGKLYPLRQNDRIAFAIAFSENSIEYMFVK